MRIALLDGYNLMHRSRFGAKADNGIIYTFFRSLRPLIAELKPDKIYFVLEGVPLHRQLLDSEYKANRRLEPDTPKWHEMVEFRRQKNIIVDLLQHLPVTLARHPEMECDDTIATLVDIHKDDECTVASNDTDFIQLLSLPNVQLFNPIKKIYTAGTTFDYVAWKALRGDKTDNVPSVGGMTDKAAEKLLSNPEKLEAFLSIGSNRDDFNRNLQLIRLKIAKLDELSLKSPVKNNAELRRRFTDLKFFSMTNDTAWNKYTETFDSVY
jgi:5'-3' exonuclease